MRYRRRPCGYWLALAVLAAPWPMRDGRALGRHLSGNQESRHTGQRAFAVPGSGNSATGASNDDLQRPNATLVALASRVAAQGAVLQRQRGEEGTVTLENTIIATPRSLEASHLDIGRTLPRTIRERRRSKRTDHGDAGTVRRSWPPFAHTQSPAPRPPLRCRAVRGAAQSAIALAMDIPSVFGADRVYNSCFRILSCRHALAQRKPGTMDPGGGAHFLCALCPELRGGGQANLRRCATRIVIMRCAMPDNDAAPGDGPRPGRLARRKTGRMG